MIYRSTARLRPVLIFSVLCLLAYALFSSGAERRVDPTVEFAPPPVDDSVDYTVQSEHDNLLLDEEQCARVFPDLTQEVDYFVAQGPFDLPFRRGVVMQGKIEDGQLTILRAPRKGELSQTMRHRQAATLQQLHRAVLTSPTALPTTYFAFAVHDQPASSSLSFARPLHSPSRKRILPMPHFSFWSWPLPFVTSLPSAARAVAALEAALPFARKDPRAVWRGTSWFSNGAGSSPRLRQDLLAAAPPEAPWADVQALRWRDGARDADNALPIHDFCRYRYVVHTEGIGYSGRLQFHQLCASVLLTPPLDWMQHTTHLMRPVRSSTLLGRAPRPRGKRAVWPVEYGAAEANVVFVEPDWSDLEDTVRWLEEHLEVAEGIAARQRATYADGGYLSPAAEACYWRALIRGWSAVARPTGEGWEGKGVPYEEFVTGKEAGKE